jgi:hypothetical protein
MDIHKMIGGFPMKALALVIGVILLAVGIAGFVPALNADGVLFGVLPMDFMRSALFAVTGAVGVMIGLSHRRELTPPASATGTNDLRPWV